MKPLPKLSLLVSLVLTSCAPPAITVEVPAMTINAPITVEKPVVTVSTPVTIAPPPITLPDPIGDAVKQAHHRLSALWRRLHGGVQ